MSDAICGHRQLTRHWHSCLIITALNSHHFTSTARNWVTFAALGPGEECGELLSRVIILIKICLSGQPAVWGDNGLNMNESLTRLHHYGLGSKYNNLGNILTQVRTIIFVLSVSVWVTDRQSLVSGECGVWCQAVLWWCDICDVTRMPRWCQDHIVSNPNCTDPGYHLYPPTTGQGSQI